MAASLSVSIEETSSALIFLMTLMKSDGPTLFIFRMKVHVSLKNLQNGPIHYKPNNKNYVN